MGKLYGIVYYKGKVGYMSGKYSSKREAKKDAKRVNGIVREVKRPRGDEYKKFE